MVYVSFFLSVTMLLVNITFFKELDKCREDINNLYNHLSDALDYIRKNQKHISKMEESISRLLEREIEKLGKEE